MRSLFLGLLCACSSVGPTESPQNEERQASASPWLQVAGPHGSQAGQPISDHGQVLIGDAVADRLSQAGGFVRVNFRLGPHASDTPAFYAAYDEIVDRLRAKGLQVLGLFSNESWPGGQADWTANNFEHRGGDGMNPYIDGFGKALLRVASHFAGRIQAWEVWNEPNCWSAQPSPGVFVGCSFIYPSNFAAMLTHSFALLRNARVPVQVVSGGIFGHDLGGFGRTSAGVEYLEKTYEIGIRHTGKFAWAKATYGTYPLDQVGQHLYINQGGVVSPSWFGTYLDWVRDVVRDREGREKPTFITEFGWTTLSVDEATQARNVKEALRVIKSRPFVRSALWFQVDDNPGASFAYGLFRADGSAKPALASFRAEAAYQGRKADGTRSANIEAYFRTHGAMAEHGSPYDNGGGVFAHLWDYGYVQDFDGGRIGRSAIFDTGHRVALGFWEAYLSRNLHHRLRFPTSEEYGEGGGTRQDFQGGYLTWTPGRGVEVH